MMISRVDILKWCMVLSVLKVLLQVKLRQQFNLTGNHSRSGSGEGGWRLRSLDANAMLRGNADGNLTLKLGGQSFTLRPDDARVAVPAAHANDAFWVGQGDVKVYVRLSSPSGMAQGFDVR